MSESSAAAIAPSPHLLDPKETEQTAKRYYGRAFARAELSRLISDQKRAIEHQQAILRGAEAAYQERFA